MMLGAKRTAGRIIWLGLLTVVLCGNNVEGAYQNNACGPIDTIIGGVVQASVYVDRYIRTGLKIWKRCEDLEKSLKGFDLSDATAGAVGGGVLGGIGGFVVAGPCGCVVGAGLGACAGYYVGDKFGAQAGICSGTVVGTAGGYVLVKLAPAAIEHLISLPEVSMAKGKLDLKLFQSLSCYMEVMANMS